MKTYFIISYIISSIYIWNTADPRQNVSNSPPCDSYIYCHGPLLHKVQMLKPFIDSKTFVDMKMKFSANEIIKNFTKNMIEWNQDPNTDHIRKFISENFEKEGTEFENWIPSDWISTPKFINSIKDTNFNQFAIFVNNLWKDLGRVVIDDVRLHSELYSLIYVPYPIIIPGGRFREMYYWDSYWIIRGLLLCEMNKTAKGMIINYLLMIKTYGHIPNGGRIYYTKRSQPPMIIPMMKTYLDATDDKTFLKENIDVLETEFNYWITKHTIKIEKNGKNYTLAIYKDFSTGPRPESYWEDVTKGQSLQTETEKENFYSELKAAAESGWDFSSRWFINNGTNQGNIINVKTSSIIPVELNALIYWGAKIMSGFYREMNNSDKAQKYELISNSWNDAVTAVLWHEEVGSWLDYDLINNKERNYFYPTNVAPLWTGCFDHNNTDYFVQRVLNYLNKTNILNNKGGIPTTLVDSKEQWDQPNAWPPLQYITVMALDNTGNANAKKLAYEIANKWICANYLVFKKKNAMYEKYLVNSVGEEGKSSGEYPLQKGFGWTNGIILEFLQKYSSTATSANCNESNSTNSTNSNSTTVSNLYN